MRNINKKLVLILLFLFISISLCFSDSTTSVSITASVTKSGGTYYVTLSASPSGYSIYYAWTNQSGINNTTPSNLYSEQISRGSKNKTYLIVMVKDSSGNSSSTTYFNISSGGVSSGQSDTETVSITVSAPTAPTITDLGVYANDTSQHVVQLSCSGSYTIYYTTTGATPTTASTSYSATSGLYVQGNTTAYSGILVPEGSVIVAMSSDGSTNSDTVSYTVPAIATPPTPTITNNGVYVSDATKRIIEITYSGSCTGVLYTTTGTTPVYGSATYYSPSTYTATDGISYTGVLVSEGTTIYAVTYNTGTSGSSTIYKYSDSASLYIRATSSENEGDIWYQHSTYDALNVFDLEDAFYTPLRSVTWGNDSAETGTINASNYIGQLGLKNCSHEILFTVETDGKFVSRSDPSKYKEYWIAMCPRYQYYGDYGYFWDLTSNYPTGVAVNSTDQAPNTKSTGSASILAPSTYSSTNTAINVGSSDGSSLYRYITTFWIDLALCMDELDSDSLKHIDVNDDYYSTVILKWECYTSELYGDTTCSHSGQYIITLRGQYGVTDVSQDAVSFIVEAEGSSQNFSIRSILNTDTKVATMQILSTQKTATSNINSGNGTGYDWNANVFAFLSSSSDYATQGSEFVLTNVSSKNYGKTIPFTVNVYDESSGTLNQSYDGTTYWNGKSDAQTEGYAIDVSESYTVTTDRYGNTYHAINYIGDVMINIPDDGTILANTDNAYSGKYESYLYYHIIYDPD